MNAAELAGYSGGTTKEFYLEAATGKAMAGGGAVIFDTSGVTFVGATLRFKSGVVIQTLEADGVSSLKSTGTLTWDFGGAKIKRANGMDFDVVFW